MKIFKFIVAFILLFATKNIVAQDLIITQEGETHKVYELEVGASSVFYKLENNENALLHKMDKNNILMIKYQDGRKQIMGEDENSKIANNENIEQKQATPASNVVDYTDNAANSAAIEYWNNIDVQYYANDKSNKKANLLYCQCELSPQSKIVDKNVELKFSSPCIYDGTVHNYKSFKVSIKNKSTETIYLDLGKCFLIRGSETIQCYTPSMTSNSSGQSIGTSVNMGSVANAVGISGALGTLAQGVNVGGGKSSSTTTTTFAQRIVPVPPMSEKEIGTIDLFSYADYGAKDIDIYNIKCGYYTWVYRLDIILEDIKTPSIGETVSISDKELIHFGTYITYSMDEAQNNPQNLNGTFSMSKIIGMKGANANKAILSGKYLKEKDLSPNYKDAIFFLAYPKKK